MCRDEVYDSNDTGLPGKAGLGTLHIRDRVGGQGATGILCPAQILVAM